MKMASSSRWNRFTVFARRNSFTGSRSPQFGRACHGAKHNAAKRNMIAWRRCVSMLDTQIPSKALSAEVVPRFDVGPLTLQDVPPPARGKMLSHSLQAFSVVAALSPLLKERVEDHRQIKAVDRRAHTGNLCARPSYRRGGAKRGGGGQWSGE